MQQKTPPNSSPVCLGNHRTHHLPTLEVIGPLDSEPGSPAMDMDSTSPVFPSTRGGPPLTPTGARQRERERDCPANGSWNETPDDSPRRRSRKELRSNSPAPLLEAAMPSSSSPLAARSSAGFLDPVPTKQRKPPSITPRKFRKFFTPRVTPRSTVTRSVLNDITRASLNRSKLSVSSEISSEAFPDVPHAGKRAMVVHDGDSIGHDDRPAKRRKTSSAAAPSTASTADMASKEGEECTELDPELPPLPPVVLPLERRGTAAQIFQRELGDIDCSFDAANLRYPVLDWRSQTADFCSGKSQRYSVKHRHTNIFVEAALHGSEAVLIGDDLGAITFLDVATVPRLVSYRKVHDNAVIDLDVSADDVRTAVASADMKGSVWNVEAGRCLATLPCAGSMRAIRFQGGPQGGNVLASSSRDGMIHVWDLRCSGGVTVSQASQTRPAASPVTQFYSAAPPRHKDNYPVVTALQFLTHGKEHLLLTACENNAELKLWDIRCVRHESGIGKPISCVDVPPNHKAIRNWAISSLALSGDGSRVYSLCKDHTVYAYSTAHLALGIVPELESGSSRPRRSRTAPIHRGLAPLYGFRHTLFTNMSFFVKCAVRPSRGHGDAELLAVGSGYGTPVLFPTDERLLASQLSLAEQMRQEAEAAGDGDGDESYSTATQNIGAAGTRRSPLFSEGNGHWGYPVANSHVAPRYRSTAPPGQPWKQETPVFTTGTPLIYGHGNKEATAMAWTPSGALVSAADDFTVRVWREDGEAARRLRVDGWAGGQRHGCGWASVEEDYDEEEW